MQEEGMARLFVGTFLGADRAALFEQLKQRNSQLSQRWRLKARFVPLPKLHLTWLFIGDVERRRIEEVKLDLQSTVAEWKKQNNRSFQIQYDKIEVWSSLKAPRVLVLESTADCPEAESLNNEISKGLSKYLEKSEKVQRFKRFRPHLTVCRFSPDHNEREAGKVKRLLSDFIVPEDFFPLAHEISAVSLIESDLNAGPNGYSSIQDIALN
ncbi:MAG TPA: RNA 2',3'-cyclic phosphodiesterase [Candidatus Melainabacteria bacterium]|nr:RNA 2',3'-cyclic phosphodiesterase [Candidatus Melainabacteria bacterium]HIN64009.1 RNA 2',3'-cyclic phosphodiesterase [Candidatus Obscuribacterales bacterium]